MEISRKNGGSVAECDVTDVFTRICMLVSGLALGRLGRLCGARDGLRVGEGLAEMAA